MRLGLLAHLYPETTCPDLTQLRELPPEPIPRWRGFCRETGFPIERLPVERALRQGVLHPEREAVKDLALSGGPLAPRGGEGEGMGAGERGLGAPIFAPPVANTRGKLLELVEKSRGTGKNSPSLS